MDATSHLPEVEDAHDDAADAQRTHRQRRLRWMVAGVCSTSVLICAAAVARIAAAQDEAGHVEPVAPSVVVPAAPEAPVAAPLPPASLATKAHPESRGSKRRAPSPLAAPRAPADKARK